MVNPIPLHLVRDSEDGDSVGSQCVERVIDLRGGISLRWRRKSIVIKKQGIPQRLPRP